MNMTDVVRAAIVLLADITVVLITESAQKDGAAVRLMIAITVAAEDALPSVPAGAVVPEPPAAAADVQRPVAAADGLPLAAVLITAATDKIL